LGADVGGALAESGAPLQHTLQRCAEAVVQHLDAAFARIWTLDHDEDVLELQASAGMYTHLDGPHGRVPVGMFKIGLIALERKAHLTNSVVGDARVGDQEWAKREGMVAFAGYPLIVENRLAGVIAMFARRALTDDTLESLSSVANIVAQGVERKRAEESLATIAHEREMMIEEVSTPVVPVLEGVLVLPLIGSLDTVRMERATRAALAEVTRQGARACIIDITGARIEDSRAVANLTNLVGAIRLVGAESYVTGVGARAAQSLVGLGLDLEGLRTYRTLAQAIAAIIESRGANNRARR
ncbi:MAG: GAF domain-containing protein, partial [Rubrivivax sp.]|nr:GAF domain-containing protein [Pyrinomonadaceae bacterium]